MSDTPYVTDDGPDDQKGSEDELQDSRKDLQGSKDRPLWAIWYDQNFGKLEVASDDEIFNSLV
jgi:hypothetical protein